ncbi:hypothetical protein FHX77_001134 [Bifidobacterium commune]|uniref:Uncharacterized protein n=1 Tax=Bifidobacterium commune TaxID=1505727 RepID=A0A1C4H5U7_9BIFI|nr:hypothetical protein [Bifidobacterium commune]SCC80133.1 hypothetical protein GA0061077_1051 [Bifidobacterium commune]
MDAGYDLRKGIEDHINETPVLHSHHLRPGADMGWQHLNRSGAGNRRQSQRGKIQHFSRHWQRCTTCGIQHRRSRPRRETRTRQNAAFGTAGHSGDPDRHIKQGRVKRLRNHTRRTLLQKLGHRARRRSSEIEEREGVTRCGQKQANRDTQPWPS